MNDSLTDSIGSTFEHVAQDVWRNAETGVTYRLTRWDATSTAPSAPAGSTMLGLQVEVDSSIPLGEVHLRQQGKTVAKIVNVVAVPSRETSEPSEVNDEEYLREPAASDDKIVLHEATDPCYRVPGLRELIDEVNRREPAGPGTQT